MSLNSEIYTLKSYNIRIIPQEEGNIDIKTESGYKTVGSGGENRVVGLLQDEEELDIEYEKWCNSERDTVSEDELKYVSDLMDEEGMDGRITFDSGELRNVTVFDTEDKYIFSEETEDGLVSFDEIREQYHVDKVYELLEEEEVRGNNSELYAELITSTTPETYDSLMDEKIAYNKLLVSDGEEFTELDGYLEEL